MRRPAELHDQPSLIATMSGDVNDQTRTARIELPGPVNLQHTLGHLWVGRGDPTIHMAGNAMVRASWTPHGPATVRVDVDATTNTARAVAAGPGAEHALTTLPALLGAHDTRDGFEPDRHEVVARFHQRLAGFRMGRTGQVVDVLAATVLGQKVTGIEAMRSWRRLVEIADQPAPTGPSLPPLLLPPSAAFLAALPTWQYTAAGVDGTRAATIIGAHRRIDRLEEAIEMDADAAMIRLTALPGLGPWTAAIVSRAARGDPDAVEVGDFHLPNLVAWNLAREPRASDERMMELLAPFAGHRGRVTRILGIAGTRAPAYGPRLAPRRFGARTPPRKGR